ncbi:ketoacid CoA transferase [Croceicoccus estronivorus]|uniref:CoA-transferase subunit beta n=1 Tax=Croceicoccus estronivorus TaxID=1172626 RepID=UPI0008325158|nr:ketoacid CoA transferase [Croceicoccus estronivorus]OCC23631.1 ketoacid CoA transferase [Croceicoccus estronivorus]
MTDQIYSLAELVIVACAEAWRNDGEVLATGIGPLPRLGAGLAKMTFNPVLQTTDGECWYTSEPVPPGKRATEPELEGLANYDRVFSALWSGKRHALVGPVQMDRFGQANISVIGDHDRPKVAMLGARGFPGNSVSHPNSFFFANHNTRAFVDGEVDFVCMAGYNPDRYVNGKPPEGLDLRIIVTNLCVMDFGGPDRRIRVVSLHPGVTFEEVQDNTGFPLARIANAIPQTPAPTAQQLELIARLDPNDMRATVFKGDPRGDRRAA